MADPIMAINLSPYSPTTADIAVGDTARVDHADCPAGTDTRRRLYLTRPNSDPDVIIAYCHNCQEAGYMRTGTHEEYRTAKHATTPTGYSVPVPDDQLVVPAHLIHEMLDWPVVAQAWAMKATLSQEDLRTWGIAYDPSSERVYLPRYNHIRHAFRGTLMGFQLRNVNFHKKESKYLTSVTEHDKGFTIMSPGTPKTVCVIVEDYVSGIHVVNAGRNLEPSYAVLVNYGVKVNLDMCYAAAQYDNVVVWLDNDADTIVEASINITRTVTLIHPGHHRVRVTEYLDPKNYTQAQIRTNINTLTSL